MCQTLLLNHAWWIKRIEPAEGLPLSKPIAAGSFIGWPGLARSRFSEAIAVGWRA
jgi:hypothetical protein